MLNSNTKGNPYGELVTGSRGMRVFHAVKLYRNYTITCSPGRASRLRGNRGAHFVRTLSFSARSAPRNKALHLTARSSSLRLVGQVNLASAPQVIRRPISAPKENPLTTARSIPRFRIARASPDLRQGSKGYWGMPCRVLFEHGGKRVVQRRPVVLGGPMTTAARPVPLSCLNCELNRVLSARSQVP